MNNIERVAIEIKNAMAKENLFAQNMATDLAFQEFARRFAAITGQPGDALAWMTCESMGRLQAGGNGSRKTVPVHAKPSHIANIPLFTGRSEPGISEPTVAELKTLMTRLGLQSMPTSADDLDGALVRTIRTMASLMDKLQAPEPSETLLAQLIAVCHDGSQAPGNRLQTISILCGRAS